MLEFKREYEETNGGKEPRCWLDKACIDQAGDINASLKALPIFLLASKYFVVFAGKTYTKRMWCVLEIFTFVRSGGTVDSILLKPLDVGEAREAITTFDIAQADCFVRVRQAAHPRDCGIVLRLVQSVQRHMSRHSPSEIRPQGHREKP